MIIAHRGYHKIEPENTLAAFRAALNLGARAIECDLRLTADGVPVISHYDRTRVNGTGARVSKSTWLDLKERRGDKERSIINLEELFEFLDEERCFAFLEVKNKDLILARAIAESVARHNLWDKVHLTTLPFYLNGALTAQKEFPRLKIIKSFIFPIFNLSQIKPNFYGVQFNWLDDVFSRNIFKLYFQKERLRKLNDSLVGRGFKTFVTVINSVEDFYYFQSAGIVNIFTDQIEEASRFAITEAISL